MTTPRDLVLARLAGEALATALATPELDQRLEQLFTDARAAWPEVDVSPEAFFPYLGERLARQERFDDAIAHTDASDLYLACACASLDAGAIALFQRRFLPGVRATLGGLGAPALVEDVCQGLMTKLFTPRADGAPGISQYQGRGELSAWLQIAATRDAYKLLAKERPRVDEIDLLTDRVIEAADPELEGHKRTYRAEFKKAFAVAFGRLTPRDRNLLRHEYIDGLNIDKIGALYGVHRATVARWRVKVRARLFKHTRQAFQSELALGPRDFDSIVRLIESQLDVSLQRLLDEDEAEPD
jgi:RNA polymerase sigma-70 factor (ECF subfamily)